MKDSAFHISTTSCSSSGIPNNVYGHGRLNAEVAALTSFSPRSAAFGPSGGDGALNLTAPAGASWTAVSNDSWIVVEPGTAAGTGSAKIFFSVRDNFNPASRTGTITIAARTYKVRQAGTAAGACTYSVTPVFGTFASSGGTGTINVTAPAGCAWTASTNASWITITSEDGGLGNGTLTYTVGVNGSGSPRKGKIKIAGTTFSVKQKWP